MAVNRDPILKKCRALELDPSYLGIFKSSHREPKRMSRKKSEYGVHIQVISQRTQAHEPQEERIRRSAP